MPSGRGFNPECTTPVGRMALEFAFRGAFVAAADFLAVDTGAMGCHALAEELTRAYDDRDRAEGPG